MHLEVLNGLDADRATREFWRCCGSRRWAERMAAARPFDSAKAMAVTADVIWASLDRADWLEAFAAHPKIGAPASGSLEPLRGANAPSNSGGGGIPAAGKEGGAPRESKESWSAQEQAGVATTAATVRDRLAAGNCEYEARFGYIFIVCATGKSAEEMLAMLERRLTNDPETELGIAAEEQGTITRLRLAKLLDALQAAKGS